MLSKAIWSHFLKVQEELGGWVPVERFMQEALYHPTFGYYSTHINTIGTCGDFATAPTLSDVFAEAIAAWVDGVRRACPKLRHVPMIELGAGNGMLARKILQRQPFLSRYWIVETSPNLRKEQKRRLGWRNVRWFESPSEALRAAKGCAILFSNELVDAFPCRVFQHDLGRWREVGLQFTESTFCEVLFDSVLPESTAFQCKPAAFSSPLCSYRVEVHESYRSWLSQWQLEWKEGCFLTIDYGGTAEEIIKRSPLGSLRAYWKQQRFTGVEVYHRVGKQDLTADVNVEDLRCWGEQLGWTTEFRSSLASFLRKFARASSVSLIDARLLSADDAGEEFFALMQWKNP